MTDARLYAATAKTGAKLERADSGRRQTTVLTPEGVELRVEMAERAGIRAATLNGSLSDAERNDVFRRMTKKELDILLVTPECFKMLLCPFQQARKVNARNAPP